MMAPPIINERKKRQWNANERNHDAQQQQQHLQVANDLAIAATFAQIEVPTFSLATGTTATATTTAASSTQQQLHNRIDNSIETPCSITADSTDDAAINNDDDNEISLEEDGSSDASSSPDSSQIVPSSSSGCALNEPTAEQQDAQENGLAMNIPVAVNDSNVVNSLNDDDDESDESDVDLAEAVARMEQDDDEEEEEGGGGGESNGALAPPKTANEVDAYHVTVKQLEKVLGTSLSTKEWEEMHVKAKAAKLNQAGHVHYHLVEDRTIVVQSMQGVLLEEGNILVIKKASSSSSSSSLLEENGWMPLGKIFEVFGPVSRPFYSVRLPDPPERKYPPVLNMPEEGDTGTVLDVASRDPCASSEAAMLVDDLEDPWEPSGKYTLLFRSSPKTLVYYLMDEATLINTSAVYQASGRGCDASNMHDEEVLNPKDMYYSDDDEEREATGKQRGRKQRGSGTNIATNIMKHSEQRIIPNNNPNRSFGGHGFTRQNHPSRASQVPGFHHSSPAMGALVSGFFPQPYPMIANNNNNNNMTLAPFNGRDHSTTGQVSASYTNNNARHAGSMIPQPGQQSAQPPAEDTVYYTYD